MRLIIILVTGCILIGATYAWSSNVDKNDKTDQTDKNNKAQVSRPLAPLAKRSETRQKQTLISEITADQSNKPIGAEKAENFREPITPLEQARRTAKEALDKKDPFEVSLEAKPFPRSQKIAEDPNQGKKKVKQLELVPPPPTGAGLGNFGDMPGPHNGFMPPAMGGGLASGLAISDLPYPPEKPSTLRFLKLTGIIGDKAVFHIKDQLTRRANHWPSDLTLATGQSFSGVKLVSVSAKDEKVTLEEHGEMSDMYLPGLR
ncbi:MAG: hypothetical protein J0M35_02475 [Candidatus Obscuribacter phosphatis]|uniref:Type IV pilus biogenesis protein PilP n=1 Tax=Candidatus Obscuribacter phosphatis TaxID=1906157 RepID=A0A8J7TJY2_9BACT|nr:hypothetical protein [Candidatus Obscuribacter phosphatis]